MSLSSISFLIFTGELLLISSGESRPVEVKTQNSLHGFPNNDTYSPLMINSNLSRLGFRLLDCVVIFLMAAISFFVTYKAGQKGFSAPDQSIMFDGGYRILTGQVPFKDFVCAHSLGVFYIQALFFKFMGVNYVAYLVCSASLSAVVTLLSIMIIRLLFPERRHLSYLAGFLTAIWFRGPHSTPWPEQTAFLFVCIALLALVFVLLGRVTRASFSTALLLVSGASIFAAFLTRQNAGGLSLILCAALILVASAPDARAIFKRLALFLVGFLIADGGFLLWLIEKSNLANFVNYYILLPSDRGFEKIANVWDILPTWQMGYLALLVIPSIVIWLYFSNLNKLRDEWKNQFVSSLLCFYLLFLHFLFSYTSVYFVSFSFIGVVFAIETGLLFHLLNTYTGISFQSELKIPSIGVLKKVFAALVVVSFIFISAKGIRIAFKVDHEAVPWLYPSYRTVNVPQLVPLKLGEDPADRDLVTPSDMEELATNLRDRGRNFFVFPDYFIFYGIIGRPSPQPLLWFNKGLTYNETYDAKLDNWIVDSLVRNKVGIVVLEKNLPPEGTLDTLNDFPKLKSFIFDNFSKTRDIGYFEVYEKI